MLLGLALVQCERAYDAEWAGLISPAPSHVVAPVESSQTQPVELAGPCPPEMALVVQAASVGFCVDRHEAQLVEIVDGTRVPHPPNQRPRAGARYEATSKADVLPQAYVSRLEASSACQAAGKRLCSRQEWMFACRNHGRTPFPYGGRYEDGHCNVGKPHLLSLVFPDRVGRLRYEEDFNDPSLHGHMSLLTATGGHRKCSTELGVFDMVGNLHEWVSDNATAHVIASVLAEVPRQWQPAVPGNGIFMGGFFSTRHEHGPGCLFTTLAHEPAYHDYSIGFRCCRPTNGRLEGGVK